MMGVVIAPLLATAGAVSLVALRGLFLRRRSRAPTAPPTAPAAVAQPPQAPPAPVAVVAAAPVAVAAAAASAGVEVDVVAPPTPAAVATTPQPPTPPQAAGAFGEPPTPPAAPATPAPETPAPRAAEVPPRAAVSPVESPPPAPEAEESPEPAPRPAGAAGDLLVALRVGEGAVTAARRLHAALVAHDKALAGACVPPETLHVALAHLRVGSGAELDDAVAALKALEGSPGALVRVGGLISIGDKVLLLDVKDDAAGSLAKLGDAVRERLVGAGVLAENERALNPRIAVAKVNRLKNKARGKDARAKVASKLPHESFASLTGVDVGDEALLELVLCRATGRRDADGFYQRVCVVPLATPSSGTEQQQPQQQPAAGKAHNKRKPKRRALAEKRNEAAAMAEA